MSRAQGVIRVALAGNEISPGNSLTKTDSTVLRRHCHRVDEACQSESGHALAGTLDGGNHGTIPARLPASCNPASELRVLSLGFVLQTRLDHGLGGEQAVERKGARPPDRDCQGNNNGQ